MDDSTHARQPTMRVAVQPFNIEYYCRWINFLLSIFLLFTCSCKVSDVTSSSVDSCQNSDVIVVSNTIVQKSREGTYRIQASENCNQQRVWLQDPPLNGGTRNYIYYQVIGSAWSGWMIGAEVCGSYGGIASMQINAPSPYSSLNNGQWLEVYMGQWIRSPDLVVSCSTINAGGTSSHGGGGLATGSIVGIVVAVILGILLTGVLIACCFVAAKKKTIRNRFPRSIQPSGGGRDIRATGNRPIYSISNDLARRNPASAFPPDYYGNTFLTTFSNTPIAAPSYDEVCYDGPPPRYEENLQDTTSEPSGQCTNDRNRESLPTVCCLSQPVSSDGAPPTYPECFESSPAPAEEPLNSAARNADRSAVTVNHR